MKRLALLLFGAAAFACNKKVDVAPLNAEAAGLAASENELIGQRGALQRERTQLSSARKELTEKRAQPHDSAGQAALDEEDKKLAVKESELGDRESQLDHKMDELLKAHDALVERVTQTVNGAPGSDPLERAAHREQSVAEREKTMAKREADLADRERGLADRERNEAKREKETCSAAPVMMAAPPVAPPKGLRYSAHDVEPVYRKALKLMQERGILPADLPPGADKLVGETREAMRAADFVRAKYSADQLLATVSAIKIDRNFIAAKMARLSSAMRGKKLEGDGHKGMESLFQDATAHYGDGRFVDANGKLNKLFAMLK